MTSLMCFVWMFIMGALIARDYEYVGEVFHHGEHGPSYEEQRAAAVQTAYTTGGIYAAFFVASVMGIAWNKFHGRL